MKNQDKIYGFSKDALIHTLLAYNKFIVDKTGDLTLESLEDEKTLDVLICEWTLEFFDHAERNLVVDIDDVMTSINDKIIEHTGNDLYVHAEIMLKDIN